jgi:hypothetical protein
MEERLANGHANWAVAEVVDKVHGHKEEAEAWDRTVRHTAHDDTRHNRNANLPANKIIMNHPKKESMARM